MLRQAALLLLLLAAAARAGGLKLKDLFDPAHEEFPVRSYGWDEWKDLSPEEKKRARGIDPKEWLEPPPEPEEDTKPKPKKDPPPAPPAGRPKYPQDRHPGFRFDRRLRRKQEAFNAVVGAAAPSTVEGLIKQLRRIDKALEKLERILAPVTEEYSKVKEQVDKASSVQIENYKKRYGRHPDQVLLPRSLIRDFNLKSKRLQRAVALLQSERHFHEWVVLRVGELLRALSPEERARPLAALTAGLQDKSWRQRLRCGSLLAALPDDAAATAFRTALQKEEDPVVLRGHVETAARARVPQLMEILKERLDDPSWPVRAAVIEALGEQRTKEAVDLLIERLDHEEGRLQDDLLQALARLTGRSMEPDTKTWKLWWDKARQTWTPPPDRRDSVVRGSDEEGVYFYGIRTRSKRIVFCIDVSGSMEFPLDGRGGKKPPRLGKAKEQLVRALNALRDDASFAIVVYNAQVSTWKGGKMLPATSKNKKTARRFVEKLEGAGATNIYDALQTSLRICGPPKGKNKDPRGDTIFFLTDGRPTHGRVVDALQILEEVTALNRRYGVVIHTVGVSKEQNAAFLMNLAQRNRGRYAAYK